MELTKDIIKKLIALQAAEYASLPVAPVDKMGHDNYTWMLGKTMSLRLPTGKEYALQAKKEQQWVPYLQKGLTLQIPVLILAGEPCSLYPYPWGIYQWLEGETLATCTTIDKCQVALDLAHFLKEFHALDCSNGPMAGKHNFYRGGNLATYHQEVIDASSHLSSYFDQEILLEVWQQALSSTWQSKPVWVHGDLVATNMLVNGLKLTSIIDFGILGIGDPACDLAMYWTYFEGNSRTVFKENVCLDEDTWHRAVGWVLWKALITFDSYIDKTSQEACVTKALIDQIIDEYIVDK